MGTPSPCDDGDVRCAVWANAGDCGGKHADLVQQLCPHSCNVARCDDDAVATASAETDHEGGRGTRREQGEESVHADVDTRATLGGGQEGSGDEETVAVPRRSMLASLSMREQEAQLTGALHELPADDANELLGLGVGHMMDGDHARGAAAEHGATRDAEEDEAHPILLWEPPEELLAVPAGQGNGVLGAGSRAADAVAELHDEIAPLGESSAEHVTGADGPSSQRPLPPPESSVTKDAQQGVDAQRPRPYGYEQPYDLIDDALLLTVVGLAIGAAFGACRFLQWRLRAMCLEKSRTV